ncbi:MAG TPA: DUF5700 domain-containing putative Zn-dependent protease [Bacteroidota bacterium]
MRKFLNRTSLCLVFLLPIAQSPAQHVDVDVSACFRMADVLSAMKHGKANAEVSAMLDSTLDTRPYKTMFRHYNRPFRPNHLPPAVFKRMILSLAYAGEYSAGENQRADQMLVQWTKFYDDFPKFLRNLEELKTTNLSALINEGVRFAQTWLPAGWNIPDFYFFIHPDGGSGGFAIDGAQGYDFFRLPRDSSDNIAWNEVVGIISHESHHLGLKESSPGPMSSSDSLAYDFLTLFVGEGTATKFVDNAPGGDVPLVDPARPAGGFAFGGKAVDSLWKVYTLKESDLFASMVETFERAYSGHMTEKQLEAETGSYWLGGLKGPAYFVGSEIFGAIVHALGKEGAFVAMQDPRRIFELYDRALKSNPELLGRCFVIPDSTVRHALALVPVQK